MGAFCASDSDCDDGLFCNGAESCANGCCVSGPPPCANGACCDEGHNRCGSCQADSDCDDGQFCNGAEKCVAGCCIAGTPPCGAGQCCNETQNVCFGGSPCAVNADCDDGLFCNGTETCVAGCCAAGPPPCAAGEEPCHEECHLCEGAETAIHSGETRLGSISRPSEQDQYEFCGSVNQRVRIVMTRTSGSFCPTIQLYPPGGGDVACSGGCYFGSASAEIDCNLTMSGSWTIVVKDDDGVETGDYKLTLLLLGGPLTAPSDPDQDGGAISSGQTTKRVIDVPSDMDGFTFQGSANQRVRIVMTRTSGSFCPTMQIYPPGGGDAACTGGCYFGSASAEVDCNLTTSGSWAIMVKDDDGVETGDYRLTLLLLGGPLTAPSEPDQDGGAISSGRTTNGMIDVPSDMDGFTFQGSANQRVRIVMARTSGDFCPTIQLYPPGGGDAACSGGCYFGSASAELDCNLTTSGSWTIVVKDDDGVETGDYNLSFEEF